MFDKIPAFSSFSVRDVEEAQRFYGDVLGLPTSIVEGMLHLTLGTGAHVMLFPKDDHQPATYTVLAFPVPDIGAAVAEAKARGVTFEHLDGVGEDSIRPGDDLGPSIAWFKDPSGNWISIFQDA
jgi:catechol 2,3-dioxygenase-like lactoylglutathione lyase family enzyme